MEALEIEWDYQAGGLLDIVDSYDKTYIAIGYDKDGNKYIASAEFSCGELVELRDIERA